MEAFDVHSLILPSDLITNLDGKIDETEDKGFIVNVQNKKIGPVSPGFFSLDSRIEELKANRIDLQVLSVSHHLFMYNAPEDVASKLSRKQNEAIAAVCRSHPDRFVGNATLPMQNSKLAVEELEHAYHQLGLHGVEIGTNVCGKNLDSEEFFPVYEKLESLKVPVLVHPNDIYGGDRLSRYYLHMTIGTLAETTLAISSVVFGRVLEKFPNLKLVFCHGGGAVPFQMGRLQWNADKRPETRGTVGSVEEVVRKLFYDTIVCDEDALRFLVERVGSQRTVFGTDYPFLRSGWEYAYDLRLDEDEKVAILSKNAKQLYGL